MSYDPDVHHRQSKRLRGYDYALAGAYFVTVCVKDHACLLGEVGEGVTHPSLFGQIAASYWERIPAHTPQVELDAFVVMPNHVHGILVLVGPTGSATGGPKHLPAGALRYSRPVWQMLRPYTGETDAPRSHGTQPGSLGAIVQNWKSLTMRRINRVRHTRGDSIWQSNYYEHIIRNERELLAIRRYILDNPAQWQQDRDHPENNPWR